MALVLLSESHDLQRFPRVQDFLSYCRLVQCAKESRGNRLGTAGKKIGTVHCRWACAEAAVLFIRQRQPGKTSFPTLEHNQGKATALTVLAPTLGRAGYSLRTRDQAVDLHRCVTAAPLRGETAPTVSLAHAGRSLLPTPSF